VTAGGPRRRFLAALLALALAAIVLAGCSDYSGTPAQRVQAWVSQNSFVSDNDIVVGDIMKLNEAQTKGTPKIVRTICSGLAYDVGTTYTTLPTPDQALTNALNDADQILFSAANSCAEVSSLTSPTMAADRAKVRQGVLDLLKVKGILRSLGVTWKIQL
jgi:hypothetical protein